MTTRYAQVRTDVEEKPLKYPKAVFFIIGNEFCERYSAFGFGAILVLYLRNALHYTEDESRLIYHSLLFMCYFFPIFGAILADSYIGKFKTLLYVSAVHAVGNISIAISATEWFFSPRFLCLLGIFLMAVGDGGIKPCVAAFGGDQFVLPQQAPELKRFFSVFYFTNNVGGLIAALSAPILREDVECFGKTTCYPLAFGMPAFLMVIAFVLFICGKPLYKMREPEGNVLGDACRCIFYALRRKLYARQASEKPSHWLDYAKGKYDQQLIDDVKDALGVIIMYIPVPIYMALSDQQGSSWIFQASQMDGTVGNWFTIKPDQLNFLNPLLVLIFIPLFETVVFPLLRKLGIKRPLQYMTIGGVLCGSAFVLAAIVEHKLEPSYAALPESGSGHLRIFNGIPCEVDLDPPINDKPTIPPLGALQLTHLQAINQSLTFKETLRIRNCDYAQAASNWTQEITIFEAQSTSYVVSVSNNDTALERIPGFDNVNKSLSNAPKLRIIGNIEGHILLRNQFDKEFYAQLNLPEKITMLEEINTGSYRVIIDNRTILSNLLMESGGVYTLILQQLDGKILGNLHTITPPASLHMLWTLPQIFTLSMAEIFFIITYLSFSFTEAPESMKSLMTAVLYVSYACGNLLVMIISKINLFRLLSQTQQYLFYSTLMALDVILLIALAVPYKYRKCKPAKGEECALTEVKRLIPSQKQEEPTTHIQEVTGNHGDMEE